MQADFVGVSVLVIKGIAKAEVAELKVEELKVEECNGKNRDRGAEAAETAEFNVKICQYVN